MTDTIDYEVFLMKARSQTITAGKENEGSDEVVNLYHDLFDSFMKRICEWKRKAIVMSNEMFSGYKRLEREWTLAETESHVGSKVDSFE